MYGGPKRVVIQCNLIRMMSLGNKSFSAQYLIVSYGIIVVYVVHYYTYFLLYYPFKYPNILQIKEEKDTLNP